jgi:hypothetical protein
LTTSLPCGRFNGENSMRIPVGTPSVKNYQSHEAPVWFHIRPEEKPKPKE